MIKSDEKCIYIEFDNMTNQFEGQSAKQSKVNSCNRKNTRYLKFMIAEVLTLDSMKIKLFTYLDQFK